MEQHRFNIGDFIRDENFGWICGTVKQAGYIGNKRNDTKCYIVDSPLGGEEILFDSLSVLVHSKELLDIIKQETAQ